MAQFPFKRMNNKPFDPMPTKLLSALILLLHLCVGKGSSQTIFNADVDVSTSVGVMPPLWRDHYENHLLHGYGGDPAIVGPHLSFVSDPDFIPEMELLKPRFIRVSIGRADNPPNT